MVYTRWCDVVRIRGAGWPTCRVAMVMLAGQICENKKSLFFGTCPHRKSESMLGVSVGGHLLPIRDLLHIRGGLFID